MNKKYNIINQYREKISSQLDTGLYKSHFVTTTFNMVDHVPDHIEGGILNHIKHLRKNDPLSPVLSHLYKNLSDYRFKTNQSLNHKIYEKNLIFNRVSGTWKNYAKLHSHLVQSLVKNATRPNKIHLHIRSYDFMDVNGSKHNNHAWDMDGTLHIHSIWLIRNEISEKFDRLAAEQFMPILWHKNLTGIRSIDAKPVGSQRDDLTTAIEYASKLVFGFDPLQTKDHLPLVFQFPLTHDERRQRRSDAQMLAAA
jgi:hypothetical protein